DAKAEVARFGVHDPPANDDTGGRRRGRYAVDRGLNPHAAAATAERDLRSRALQVAAEQRPGTSRGGDRRSGAEILRRIAVAVAVFIGLEHCFEVEPAFGRRAATGEAATGRRRRGEELRVVAASGGFEVVRRRFD